MKLSADEKRAVEEVWRAWREIFRGRRSASVEQPGQWLSEDIASMMAQQGWTPHDVRCLILGVAKRIAEYEHAIAEGREPGGFDVRRYLAPRFLFRPFGEDDSVSESNRLGSYEVLMELGHRVWQNRHRTTTHHAGGEEGGEPLPEQVFDCGHEGKVFYAGQAKCFKCLTATRAGFRSFLRACRGEADGFTAETAEGAEAPASPEATQGRKPQED